VTSNFVRADMSSVERICTTFASAFWDDPVMRWLFPDDEVFRDGTVMRDFFRRLITHGHSYVTPDIVAFAMWIPPGRPDVEVEPTSTEMPPPELLAKFIALRGAIADNTPDELHWYLQMVGTHPDWQRRGIGSRLIRNGIERAHHDGLPVYLETETAENVTYYRHLGFEVRSEWDVAEGGPHMWGMWHPCS
jgi:ribosomal protein S18 acetylase RimI-like enzyme